MNLISTISDTDFFPEFDQNPNRKFLYRTAARSVIVNDKNEFGIINVKNYGYHKIPGGGIEPNENIQSALKREVLEESGSEIKIIAELGIIIEVRDFPGKELGLVQISYGFLSKVTNQTESNFTEDELAEGFEFVWLERAAAQKAFSYEPDEYEAKFMQKRDGLFFSTALATLT